MFAMTHSTHCLPRIPGWLDREEREEPLANKQDKSLAFTGMSSVVVEGKFLSKIGSDRLTDRTRRKESGGM